MKKRIKIVLIITILLLIFISGSYAFFGSRFTKNGSSLAVTETKKLGLIFDDGPEINIQGILPGQTVIKTFSVTNNGNQDISYNLLFRDVINELNRTNDLVYSLEKDGVSIVNDEVVPTEEGNLFVNILISPNTTQNYRLIINYINANTDQFLDMDKLITFRVELSMNNLSNEFVFNDHISEFIVPRDGYYRLEAWGAQGGAAEDVDGGYGAYSRGEIYLHQGDVLLAVVGSAGETNTYDDETVDGGYNGGGSSHRNSNLDATDATRGSGGGASHIAIKNNNYTTLDTYGNKATLENYVLVVAAGGGGSAKWQEDHIGQGGNGGGIIGNNGTCSHEGVIGEGGTQSVGGTFNGSFGLGGNAIEYIGYNNYAGGAGAGGGLYGGGYSKNNAGAGGGSSYINTTQLTDAYMVCKDCTESDATATKTLDRNCVSSNAQSNCSKMGDGAIRISYIKKVTITIATNYNEINLGTMLVNKGTQASTLNLDFDNYSNYMLVGCYFDSNYTQQISVNSDAIIGNDTTIYCRYRPCFQKSFTLAATDTFTASEAGTYKIEAWGAQGGSGNGDRIGGYGGYATGEVVLAANDKLYINVGEAGNSCPPQTEYVNGGYNGGGKAYHNANGDGSGSLRGSGGGATSVTTTNRGELSEYDSHRDEVILVAGGGGGAASWSTQGGYAGNGGGNNGTDGTVTGDGAYGTGGTQSAGGATNNGAGATASFGQGGNAIQSPGWGNSGGAGGGGGYFGGGYGMNNAGAGGGSGYYNSTIITNGSMVCYNCEPTKSAGEITNTTTCHNTKAITGCAKEGNGFIKIYKIS